MRWIPSSPGVNRIYGVRNGNFLRGVVFAFLEENVVVDTSQQECWEQYNKCKLPAFRQLVTSLFDLAFRWANSLGET